MKKNLYFGQMIWVAALCLTAVFAIQTLPAPAQSGEIDGKAEQLLRQMSDYLAGLKQFSVQTENSLEVILRTGEKIQYNYPADLIMQRPNKFKATRTGDIVKQAFYYDGNTLTLYQKDFNYYATIDAPANVDETLDFAREYLDIHAPGGDLVYTNAYDILTEDMVSGSYVGMSVIDNIKCHHLSFRNNEVDWQIWIQADEKPLPRKFIVTSKWMTGAPQFALVIKDWNLSPDISEDLFTFVPPKDAKPIDFISLTGAGESRR